MTTTATRDPKTNVYTIHSLGEIEVDTRLTRVAAMDEVEARRITDAIKGTTVRLWLLVTEAHDRKAHLALGYETWADYVKAEFKMSESRSYQFLDTGHVMKALAAAGIDVDRVGPPPARVVARIKDRLTDVKRAVSKVGDDPEEIDRTLRALAREPRAKPKGRPRGVAAAQAAAAQAETPGVSRGSQRPRGTDTVTCPACRGTGQVTLEVAELVADVMKKVPQD